jgi:hypothetical protein
MGGVVSTAGRAPGAAPTFVVAAQRDPGTPERPGGALERIQIVKLWLGAGGASARVYDVAGRAEPGEVDPATCAPAAGGVDQLCAVWTDAEFTATQPALYYVRVLERPSCRWTGHACLAAGVECGTLVPRGFDACCDAAVPRSIRERAWTSPIWVVPEPERQPAPPG